jgi:hypothetical protein
VKKLISAGAALLLAFCTGISNAQVASGTISGTVKDSSGAVLAGVDVVVLNEDTGISRKVRTDANGHYSAVALSLGNYRVTGSHEGFEAAARTGIVLTVGRDAIVNFELNVGSIAQTVEVHGEAPLVETTTGSLGSLVDSRTIRALPLNGRSYDQLALLQPGVVATNPGPPNSSQLNFGTGKRFTVGGQRPVSNTFLLDGTIINDQGNGTPGGASGTNLGVDTIREFKIYTSSYSAEYGHTMGSVVTAVTRSGTNDLHGTVFEYIRNSALDARNYFDVGSSPPPFKRNQFGGVMGGPIKKDKTFFFGGYEGLRQGLGTTQIATVPTALARQGVLPSGTVTVNPTVVPYLKLYPLPNGQDFGDGSAEFLSSPVVVTNEDNFMGRVDHQLSQSTGVFGRYMYDADDVNAPTSLPGQVSVSSSRRQYATLQAQTILGPKTLNSFIFAFNRPYSLIDFHYIPNPTSLAFIPGQELGTIQVGAVAANTSRAITQLGPTAGNGIYSWAFNFFQFSDDFIYNVGKHSFKTGAALDRVRDNQRSNSNLRGTYTFPTVAALLQGRPSNEQAQFPMSSFTNGFRQWIASGYAQDDYLIASSLTLNYGLRWETVTDPREASRGGSILPSLAAASMVVSDSFFNVTKKNFEPRLGVAWRVNESGKTVLRAGTGIYHNQILPWFYGSISKNPPFAGIVNASNPPFPDGLQVLKPGALVNLLVPSPLEKTPTNYQYNLSIQQVLSKNTVIQFAYAGNTANHLEVQSEGDPAVHVVCSAALANCPAGLADGTKYFPVASPRVNPAWAGIRYYQMIGNSNYDSGTVTLRRQSPNGFEGQIFYTFSKALDENSGISPADSLRSPQAVLDPENPARDWGLADFDARHNLVFNFSYPLHLRADSNLLGKVMGNWTLNGIGTFSSGLPLTALLATSVSRNLASSLAERPNLRLGFGNNPNHGVSSGCQGFAAGTSVGNANHWYDPCAFSSPIPGTYGNLGRNTIIGPGIQDVDMALERHFELRRRASINFRAEMFNVLNHANFGLPNTTSLATGGAANAAAGRITYTITSSRQVQFALRIGF